MASRILYVVCIRIPVKDEKKWNAWHDREHIPRVLALPGFIEVRKFRSMSSTRKEAEYFVLYELRNRQAYQKYVRSEDARLLREDSLDHYGYRGIVTRWVWEETFRTGRDF